MNIFYKIQKLSETKRKLILWAIVIVFSLLLFFFWTRNFQRRLQKLKIEMEKEREEISLPQFQVPKIELPEISREDLKELEEIIKEAEKEMENKE